MQRESFERDFPGLLLPGRFFLFFCIFFIHHLFALRVFAFLLFPARLDPKQREREREEKREKREREEKREFVIFPNTTIIF